MKSSLIFLQTVEVTDIFQILQVPKNRKTKKKDKKKIGNISPSNTQTFLYPLGDTKPSFKENKAMPLLGI